MNEAELFAQVVALFRVEATSLVEKVRTSTRALLRSGESTFSEDLETAMRQAHNLKGAAASVGFLDVETLAHAIEDALVPARERREVIHEDLVETIDDALRLCLLSVDGKSVSADVAAQLARLGATETSPHSARPERMKVPERAPTNVGRDQATSLKDQRAYLQVETTRLDRLMRSVEGLLPSQQRLLDFHQGMTALREEAETLFDTEGDPRVAALFAHWDGLLRRQASEGRLLNRTTTEILESLEVVRMVPLDGAVAAWKRVIRDAEHHLDKRVDLETHLENIEVDKVIFERLREPILHVLRNAVAHGIEDEEARRKAGKAVRGQLTVRASVRGSTVRIEIGDDGKGLDPVSIGRRAVQMGILEESELSTLGPADCLDLVFRPGFSTTEAADRVSGRGVGLDVVRSALAEIGGGVNVTTEQARGSVFSLHFPLTLVSATGLFVRHEDERVVLSLDLVKQVLAIPRSSVRTDGKQEGILLGSELVPLAWLSEALGSGRARQEELLQVVVLEFDGQTLGLVVSEVIGERSYVLRRLPWDLAGSAGVSGAILEGDGTITLALEPRWLARTREVSSAPVTRAKSRRILVVDDTLTARVLAANMLSAAGFDVTQAEDGQAAWDLLSDRSFDMLVSDVEMPFLNGLELTRRVRKSPHLEHLPVILVTTLSGDEHRAAGAAAGADEYVIKGQFDAKKLVDVVSRHFHQDS